jgi:two-component system OmpR family response regulator
MAKSEILLLSDGSQPFWTIGWVLEYKDLSIKAVRGTEAALEALVQKNYDLIIASLTREGKDNLTVLRQAKKINALTKIILITDKLDLVFPLEAYEIDVDDYIIMPISIGEFWCRVENCLEGLMVIDLTPEISFSQSVSEENSTYNPLTCDPMFSATIPEVITAC